MQIADKVKIDGEKLRELRVARWLDRREVADAAGLSLETLAAIERGKWPGSSKLSTVRKLAAALEVDPSELVAEGE